MRTFLERPHPELSKDEAARAASQTSGYDARRTHPGVSCDDVMSNLNLKAFSGLLFLFLVMATLLFIAAGTLDYWQAWVFLAVYFLASLAITLDLMKRDPKLLERRMRGGPTAEKEPVQKIISSSRCWDLSGFSSSRRSIIATAGRSCIPMWRSPATR